MGKLLLAGMTPRRPGLPVGEFCDAAWAAQIDYLLTATPEHQEHIHDLWRELSAPIPGDEGLGAAEGATPTGPTMETWGADDAAQAAQADLMSMIAGIDPRAAQANGAG